MDRSVARIGAWAGWTSLAGILGYHLALAAAAGPRVSGTVDAAAIAAYYSRSIVAVASVEQFVVVIAVAVFAVALRETLLATASPSIDERRTATTARMRLYIGVGLVALIAELPVILVVASTQAALVTAVAASEPTAAMFRLWDVLYNSAVYGLEATWVLAFGAAMTSVSAFPSFLRWLSPLAALLLGVNVFAIWIGIPDAATLPSALGLVVWLAGASIGLGRLARREQPFREVAPQPTAG